MAPRLRGRQQLPRRVGEVLARPARRHPVRRAPCRPASRGGAGPDRSALGLLRARADDQHRCQRGPTGAGRVGRPGGLLRPPPPGPGRNGDPAPPRPAAVVPAGAGRGADGREPRSSTGPSGSAPPSRCASWSWPHRPWSWRPDGSAARSSGPAAPDATPPPARSPGPDAHRCVRARLRRRSTSHGRRRRRRASPGRRVSGRPGGAGPGRRGRRRPSTGRCGGPPAR